MNANMLAGALILKRIPVLEVSEPGEVEDGLIQVTKEVHVQVPLDGTECLVVIEDGDVFIFSKPVTMFNDLVALIWEAVKDGDFSDRK